MSSSRRCRSTAQISLFDLDCLPGPEGVGAFDTPAPLQDAFLFHSTRRRLVQVLRDCLDQRVEAAASVALTLATAVWWGDRTALVSDPFARCSVCHNMATVENEQPVVLYDRSGYIICSNCEANFGQPE